MEVPDYDLPAEAIAQSPAEPRDTARLLNALSQPPEHLRVSDLPRLVGEGDVLVVNTSRVVPARLLLHKRTGGAAEVLLLETLPGHGAWEAMVRPGRRLPPGTVLWASPVGVDSCGARAGVGAGELAPAAPDAWVPVVEVGERLPGGTRQVRSLVEDLSGYGELALPPYIHQRLADPERYQTVYSDRPGSVAAPTAGLHLTPEVLAACRARGAKVVALDLAVGPGTFKPIKTGQVEDHEMHAERYFVPEVTWEACQEAKRRNGRVIAVGTTSVRALESAASTGALEGRTELFIRPGHLFSVVDVLMTNFHQPRSTLLVLLEAFAGPRWRDLYASALAEGYRFLSFGDAMIVASGVRAASR
ncbi:MAG: tRNA preQ1(34) S-adenosylmethionine ribosyltransferase-isomerase QueA [Actinobacteria bacterium]|nr:tRNA preQ1(34) S-adenosylmethionine ribosyltransferase-isomerase QueA [Actinomycetota bacterium]